MLNINKINEVFKESKLSKVDIAKGCGFTRPTLDGILNGADVKISTLISWAKFFGKPVSFFLEDVYEDSVKIGDGSTAAVNVSGTIHGGQNVTTYPADQEIKNLRALLDEKERIIAEKDALLAEKERTIQILLSRN